MKNKLGLDTTGEFLRIGRHRHQKKEPARKVVEPWKDLFFKNAFLLYEHREEILSDRRMALTPLPFENVLAYMGTSGLRNATLGVYLEWWDACGDAVIKDFDGNPWALTYILAGSPLTGANDCRAVTRDGRTFTVKHKGPFRKFWQSFMAINARYAEAKEREKAFTLEKSLRRLKLRLAMKRLGDFFSI